MMEVLNRSLDCACSQAAETAWNNAPEDREMDPMEHYYTVMAENYNRREGDLHLQDGYVCEQCKNKGYIAKAIWSDLGYWTQVEYECSCMPIRRNIGRMRKSGLQDVIARYRFDTYDTAEPWQEAVKTLAMEYAQAQINGTDLGKWFFIGGASGAGKSHICTAICTALLHDGKEVQYMLWRDVSVKLKATVNDATQYEARMQELKTAEVLYIDDFLKSGLAEGGTQKPTAADLSLAFELLNARYNNPNAITIISSESTLDAIFSLDEAVGGRIGERSLGYAINLSGKEKNYRRKMLGVAV